MKKWVEKIRNNRQLQCKGQNEKKYMYTLRFFSNFNLIFNANILAQIALVCDINSTQCQCTYAPSSSLCDLKTTCTCFVRGRLITTLTR